MQSGTFLVIIGNDFGFIDTIEIIPILYTGFKYGGLKTNGKIKKYKL